MSRLYLLRHAKAAWPLPGMRDFDRPLEPSGCEDAARLGAIMKADALVPADVLCSTAARARETWHHVAAGLGFDEGSAQFTDELYSTDVGGYADLIRAQDSDAVLVIGHNPMLEDLALALATDDASADRKALSYGFSTCGLAVLDFAGPLSQSGPEKGLLRAFITPDGH